MKTIPEHFTEHHDSIMSNFDHMIDYKVADEIKNQPMWAEYPGWDFYGKVWFEDNKWHCAVKCYGSHVNTISEDNLEDLKSSVCDQYGDK